MPAPIPTTIGLVTPSADDLAYMDYLNELAEIPTGHGLGLLLFKADPVAFSLGRDEWLERESDQ